LSPPSRPAQEPQRTGPVTVHEKIFFVLLVALAFLMPFRFGFFSLDTLPNPNFGGPSIGSLLVPLASWPTEMAELLVVLAAFFWLLGMIVTRRLTFRYTRACFFLWAFLVVGLVSSFFSILPHSAVIFMKEFACWALLYHLVVNMSGGERRERALVAALMAGMVCVSLIGLHQRLFGYEQMLEQVYRSVPAEEQGGAIALLDRARVMGTFASPNSLGGLYALLLPAACLFVLVMRQWTRKHGATPAIFYGLFGPVLAFGVLILTESKGAFISVGLVAIAAAFALHKRLKIRAWKLAVILIAALAAAAAISMTGPGRKLIGRGAHTFEERIGYWRGAARMAADRPVGRNLVGSGFNAFSALFPKYKDAPQVVGMARSAHNNYVQLFVEVGVLGLAAFAAFWIVHLVRAGRIVRAFARGKEELKFKTTVVLAAFFGLLGFLLHSLVDFDLYVPGIAMTAMLLVGLLARHTGAVREKTMLLRKEIHAVGALAVLMVVTAPLVLFMPMPLTGEVHFYNAAVVDPAATWKDRQGKTNADRLREAVRGAVYEYVASDDADSMRRAEDIIKAGTARYLELLGFSSEEARRSTEFGQRLQNAVTVYTKISRFLANEENSELRVTLALEAAIMNMVGEIQILEVKSALQWDWLNHNFMGYLGAISMQRGIHERNANDLDEADRWYTRALELHPNSYVFRYRRAIVRLERMRLGGKVEWDPILEEIRGAVAHYPTDSFMRLRYVYHLDQAGREKEAQRQFNIAASDDDEVFSIALQTASCSYNDFDLERALERLRAKYGTREEPPADETAEGFLGE